MDLSDGLSLDLHRLCLASGVAARIEPPPLYRGATLAQALHGGEDYELLFTLAPGTRVPDAFEGVPLTRIGEIRRGTAGAVLLAGHPLKPGGWDHFRTWGSRPPLGTRRAPRGFFENSPPPRALLFRNPI